MPAQRPPEMASMAWLETSEHEGSCRPIDANAPVERELNPSESSDDEYNNPNDVSALIETIPESGSTDGGANDSQYFAEVEEVVPRSILISADDEEHSHSRGPSAEHHRGVLSRLSYWSEHASGPKKLTTLILALLLCAAVSVSLYALSGIQRRAGGVVGSLLAQGPQILGTLVPTTSPTSSPSITPSSVPSVMPSSLPSMSPSSDPSSMPTDKPSLSPSSFPSKSPSASPSSSPTVTPIIFYVMGDVPYSGKEAGRLVADIARIPSDAEFVVHVGDMNKAKDTNCTEATFSDVRNILTGCKYPTFIIPGDNDVFDCPNEVMAWNYWKRHLLYLDRNWQHSLPVQRQFGRTENFSFLHESVLFVGVNYVAGSGGGSQERKYRRKDNENFVLQKINAYRYQMIGLVIFAHYKPEGDFKKAVAEEIEKLGIPALYIHGNGHKWKYEKKAFGVKDMIRVQVDAGGKAPPVRVRFRADAEEPFEFDRRK